MPNNDDQRTMRLIAARQQASADKRTRVTVVIDEMLAQGIPITATTVARGAACSTWLVYSHGVRDHLEQARRHQAENGLPTPTTSPRTSTAGLETDLALARHEVSRLRSENQRLHHRLELQLGTELDEPAPRQLRDRIRDLETAHRELLVARDAAHHRAEELEAVLATTREDLDAARAATRRVLRAMNTRPAGDTSAGSGAPGEPPASG
jgi:hypothetical protein